MRLRASTSPAVVVVLLAIAGALSACGEERTRAASPGSPENPAVAREFPGTTEPTTAEPAGDPGYRDLVEGQSRKPAREFSACGLVTPAQARTIIGERLSAPIEAPQGPTCIYRKRTGETVATLAVETADTAEIKRRLRGIRRVVVSDRPAFCGRYDQPVLHAGLPDGRVLTVAAPCDVARRFAARALTRLGT
jgi:hypothetical protein